VQDPNLFHPEILCGGVELACQLVDDREELVGVQGK
jgi:hypothetical protein